MAFIKYREGTSYPSFLASEVGIRTKTRQIEESMGTDGIVKPGTIYPADGANAEGLVFETVDVSSGAVPGPVMTAGEVYEDQLPAKPSEAAKTAMQKLGMVFIPTKPKTERP